MTGTGQSAPSSQRQKHSAACRQPIGQSTVSVTVWVNLLFPRYEAVLSLQNKRRSIVSRTNNLLLPGNEKAYCLQNKEPIASRRGDLLSPEESIASRPTEGLLSPEQTVYCLQTTRRSTLSRTIYCFQATRRSTISRTRILLLLGHEKIYCPRRVYCFQATRKSTVSRANSLLFPGHERVNSLCNKSQSSSSSSSCPVALHSFKFGLGLPFWLPLWTSQHSHFVQNEAISLITNHQPGGSGSDFWKLSCGEVDKHPPSPP